MPAEAAGCAGPEQHGLLRQHRDYPGVFNLQEEMFHAQ